MIGAFAASSRGVRSSLDELLQDERVGEVVDVLGRAREMHHLNRQCRIDRGDSLLDEILDRLDVVIGGRFELFDAARIIEREVLVNGAELFRSRGRNRFQRTDRGMPGQRQVPFDLDANAVANQRELAEVCLQGPRARAVAAVDRRHRGQCRVGLGRFVFHRVLMKLNYVGSPAQSRGVRRLRSAAGVSEAAGAARARRQFIDLDDVGANNGRDDELGDSIAGFDHDRLLAQIHK